MDPYSVGNIPLSIDSLFSSSSEQKNEPSPQHSRKIAGIFSFLCGKSRDKGSKKLEKKATDMTNLSSTDAQEESKFTVAWASDIHFDHVNEKGVENFLAEVINQKPSVLLLAGDIDLGKENPVHELFRKTIPAKGLVGTIKKIKEKIDCPVYFICGNHDFYFSSFEEVRKGAREFSLETDGILYIHETSGIELDEDTVLIGHDGWGDSRSGDFWNSHMALNDFFLIKDFNLESAKEVFTPEVKAKLEKLGDLSADYAERVLPDLLKKYKRVVLLTHVPPFREASWHEGKICVDAAAPFFVNQALGTSLEKMMKEHPENELLVLCGHTHSHSIYHPLSNLCVLTAGAEYGRPSPQQPIILSTNQAKS